MNSLEFDIIIEMLANANLSNDMKAARQNGKIVIVGNRGDINITPRDIMASEASIIGCSLFNSTCEDMKNAGDVLKQGLRDGKLKPFIDREYKMENVQDAHIYVVDSKKKSVGKVIMTP